MLTANDNNVSTISISLLIFLFFFSFRQSTKLQKSSGASGTIASPGLYHSPGEPFTHISSYTFVNDG